MEERPPASAAALRGESIICIASGNWDAALWTNSQHLMSRLARENRVLFVESLGLRRPSARWRDVRRIGRRLRNWAGGVRRARENLLVYSPVIAPFHGSARARALNRRILVRGITRIAKKHGFENPILWTFLPTGVDLVGHLGESLAIYHCVDEYGANPGAPASVIQGMERELLAKADLVFVTSRALYEGRRARNPNTHYLPNVADAEHFRGAALPGTAVPEELRSLPRPVVGFVGALSAYKVDFGLLLHAAREHPEWSFALVGPVWAGEEEVGALRGLPNVRFFGPRPYAELPGWLKGFDVCVIPFVLNETTRNVFPMKFHEYLATGKPVVSVDLPSLEEYRGLARTARGAEEFARAIEDALRADPEGASEERIAVARGNTWEARLVEIARIIDEKRRMGGRKERAR